MTTLSDRIIEMLKKSGQISEEELRKAVEACKKEEKTKLSQVLVQKNLITEKELFSLISLELKIPFLNLARYRVSSEMAQILPEKLARKHKVVPISKIGDTLTLAMVDPSDILATDDIAILTKSKIECVMSTEKDIEDCLDKIYGGEGESMDRIAKEMSGGESDFEIVKGDDETERVMTGGGEEAPVVKIVDLLLLEALKKRASDIHIEPFEKNVRVRYRVDGALKEVLAIPKKNQNAVLTRVKIMSKLDITENRVPQDGRIKIKTRDKEVDFRVSILPVHFGSKVVMRILDKSGLGTGLDSLGFLPESLSAFKSAVLKPFGMILITGPTGSGKSTTLYSILNQLNTPEKNLITIEDPIEYQVKGITQIQAKPEIGLDFASGLRAILRQSPDVVMVGEIRDSETADIAIKASLTGQLVLSTLHTNDAAGAMTRLVDMGVEPFLIASSVILVAAQRLCRRVCPSCREKVDIPKEVFDRLGVVLEKIAPNPKERHFFVGKGCVKCGHTGYYGRMGLLETLVVDDSVRDLVVRRASSHEIKQYAVKKGMTPLREDALKKFCQGLTTLDEVIRITSEEE
jgi:type IV pilus assembly protein PilB